MLWIQLSTLALFNLLLLVLLVSATPVRLRGLSTAQHGGAGAGSYTVWQLIAHIEAERRANEPTGRHHLRA